MDAYAAAIGATGQVTHVSPPRVRSSTAGFASSGSSAFAWTGFFTLLNALADDQPWTGALLALVYFGSAAAVIMRWGGLLAFVVGAFVSPLFFDMTATADTSAWYFGNMMLLVAIPLALACWGFYTAAGGFAGQGRVPVVR